MIKALRNKLSRRPKTLTEEIYRYMPNGEQLFTFSLNGNHFMVKAKDTHEAWDKARRLVGDNDKLLRVD